MLVIELARLVLAELDSQVGPPIATRFVAKRYAQLVGLTGRENSERAEAQVTLPATIATGAVTVTVDSTTVAGDATAQAAWASEQLRGRYFRLAAGNPFYRIGAQSAASLTLEHPYAAATAAASGYEVFARHVSLADDVRHVGQVTHDERPLQQVSVEWLDRIFPDRDELDDEPRYWADAGEDDDGRLRIEVCPPATSNNDVVLRYTYHRHPVVFEPNDRLPSHVDVHVLEKGVMADVCRRESKTMDREAMTADAQKAAVLSDMAGRRLNEALGYERDFERLRIEGLRAARPGRGPRIYVEDPNDAGKRPIIRARDEVFRDYTG